MKIVVDTIKRIRCCPQMEENTKKDISDDDRETVIEWMRSLNLPFQEQVYVIWIANREGISVNLHDFIEHYDDLWYPGADDIWITCMTNEWLLEFSHEEEVILYTFSQTDL